MAGQTINISVLTDTAPATRGLADLGGKAGGLLGKVGTGIAVGLAAVTVGVVATIATAGGAVAEVQRLSAQTSAVIESTGGAADRTLEQVIGLADGIERMTGVEAEAVTAGQNLLLTFTNIQGTRFDEATNAAVDLSVAMGTDMTSAATLVGKALNDPIRGLASLSRVGVQFTDEQRAMIEQMVAVGDTAGAQGVILAELERQFGGSAEAFGNTFLGGVEKVKNAYGELTEGIVGVFGPVATAVVQEVAGELQAFADSPAYDSIVAGAQGIADRFLAWTAEDGIITTVGTFLSDFTLLGQAIQWAGDNQGAANGIWETFSGSLSDIGDALTSAGLLDALEDLGDELGGTLATAVSDLAPQLPGLVTNVADLLIAVLPLVPEIVDLATELVPVADVVIDLVAQDVLPLAIDLLGDLLPIVEDLVPIVGDAAEGFGDWLAVIPEYTDAMETLLGVIGDDATASDFAELETQFGDLITSMDGFLAWFGIDYSGYVDSFVETFTPIGEFVMTLPGIAQEAWAQVTARFDNARATISITVQGIRDFVVGKFDEFRSSLPAPIRDGVDGVIGFFQSLPKRIENAIGGVPKTLRGIGQSMIQGLIDGVSGGGGGLVSTLINLVTNATSQTKAALGINSPSRVFRAIGLGIPEGLSLGVLDGRPMVSTALGSLADVASDFQPDPLTLAADRIAGYGSDSAPQRVYNITVHAIAPGPEVGRAIVESIADYEQLNGARR